MLPRSLSKTLPTLVLLALVLLAPGAQAGPDVDQILQNVRARGPCINVDEVSVSLGGGCTPLYPSTGDFMHHTWPILCDPYWMAADANARLPEPLGVLPAEGPDACAAGGAACASSPETCEDYRSPVPAPVTVALCDPLPGPGKETWDAARGALAEAARGHEESVPCV